MARPKTDDIDPHTLARDLFNRLGGIDGMTRWAKNKQTLAYQLIANLMKQPASTTFNKVTIKVNDGEAARRKLEDAFLQLIESRKYENVDPAAFINNERVEPLTIEHQAADPRSQPPDPTHQAASDDSTSPQKGPFFSRGGVATTSPETTPAGGQNKNSHYSKPIPSIPGLAAGAAVGEGSDDNLSTTEKFLRWNGHGKM